MAPKADPRRGRQAAPAGWRQLPAARRPRLRAASAPVTAPWWTTSWNTSKAARRTFDPHARIPPYPDDIHALPGDLSIGPSACAGDLIRPSPPLCPRANNYTFESPTRARIASILGNIRSLMWPKWRSANVRTEHRCGALDSPGVTPPISKWAQRRTSGQRASCATPRFGSFQRWSELAVLGRFGTPRLLPATGVRRLGVGARSLVDTPATVLWSVLDGGAATWRRPPGGLGSAAYFFGVGCSASPPLKREILGTVASAPSCSKGMTRVR